MLCLETDDGLVALFRSGCDAAFEPIVLRHRASLLAYCRRRVGRDQAEDLVQDIFAVAHVALRVDDRAIRLKPWLYGIAKNLVLKASLGRSVQWSELEPHMGSGGEPFEFVERKEQLRGIIDGIQMLPEQERSALVLREFEGRSSHEIALTLRLTPQMVCQLVFRARSRIRGQLASLALTPGLLAGKAKRAFDAVMSQLVGVCDSAALEAAAAAVVVCLGSGAGFVPVTANEVYDPGKSSVRKGATVGTGSTPRSSKGDRENRMPEAERPRERPTESPTVAVSESSLEVRHEAPAITGQSSDGQNAGGQSIGGSAILPAERDPSLRLPPSPLPVPKVVVEIEVPELPSLVVPDEVVSIKHALTPEIFTSKSE